MKRIPWLVLWLAPWGCLPDLVDLSRVHPRLVADQERLDLGETRAGHELRAFASFTNTGDATVRFSARLEPAESSFSITLPATTVHAGEQAKVDVRFMAFDPDVRALATLVVDHDGDPGTDGSRTLRVILLAQTAPLPECDDHNPCTLDGIDPSDPARCVFQPVHGPCDDANACTTGDRCESGQCVGRVVSCDDGVPCTADSCDAVAGCVHVPTDSWCTGGAACLTARCQPGIGADGEGCIMQVAANGTACGAPSCEALPLCMEGQCRTVLAPDGYPCDDRNACTRGDSCMGGICQPGTTVASGVQVPIVVRNGYAPTQPAVGEYVDAPLFEQWVTTVDAVGIMSWMEVPHVQVLWRGASGTNAEYCYLGPIHCGRPSWMGSMQPPGMQVSLNLSTVTLDGVATDDVQLPLDRVYQLATRDGPPGSCTTPPPGVIAAVAALATDQLIGGAAVVHYNGGCADFSEDVDSEEPRPLPTSTVLVVFESWDGHFMIRDAVWLGTDIPSPLVHGNSGEPLLAVDAREPWLSVVYATPGVLGTCTNGTASCLDEMVLHLRNYSLGGESVGATLGPAWEQSVWVPSRHPGVLDEVGELSVFREESSASVFYTQLMEEERTEDAVCRLLHYNTYPQTMGVWEVMGQTMLPGGTQMGPMPIATGVSGFGYGVEDHALVYPFWRREAFLEGVCKSRDQVFLRRPPGQNVALYDHRGSWGNAMTTTRVQTVGTRTFTLATLYHGQHVLVSQAENHRDTVLQVVAWPMEADALMYPGSAPILAQLGDDMVLVSVANLGVYRNSNPTPAMAMTWMGGCRPASPSAP